MAESLHDLAEKWKSDGTDIDAMRRDWIDWKRIHTTPAHYVVELPSLDRTEAQILYDGIKNLELRQPTLLLLLANILRT